MIVLYGRQEWQRGHAQQERTKPSIKEESLGRKEGGACYPSSHLQDNYTYLQHDCKYE